MFGVLSVKLNLKHPPYFQMLEHPTTPPSTILVLKLTVKKRE